MTYYVYILKSKKDGSHYIGHTQDVGSRLIRHNQGRVRYTKEKRPWDLVHCEEYDERSAAMRREIEIKNRKSKRYLDSLVRTSRQT